MSILRILLKKTKKSSKPFKRLMSNESVKIIFLKNYQFLKKNNKFRRFLTNYDIESCIIPWLPQNFLKYFFMRRNSWTNVLFNEDDVSKLYYFFENYVEIDKLEKKKNHELRESTNPNDVKKKSSDSEYFWFDIVQSELKFHNFYKIKNETKINNFTYDYIFIYSKQIVLQKFYFYINFINLYFKSFKYYDYFRYFTSKNLNILKSTEHILLLNFKRYRFFPNIQTMNGWTYSTISLGVIRKFLKKPKSFIKNKFVYLVVANFFRKILLYAGFQNLILFIKKTPIYLSEIMSTLKRPSLGLYQHPFKYSTVDEKLHIDSFFFLYILFLNSKTYGFMKFRKKGRIKRKILKRLVKLNKLVD